jgi:polyisoprenoid-binding protein YceI
MTNYLAIPVLAVLLAGTAPAAEKPAAPAAAPAARYLQATAGNSLSFTFTQLDAASSGQFKKFTTELVYDEKNPAAGSLDVKIDITSLDTQDAERDEALKGADLLDTKTHPTATYVAKTLARNSAGGLEAVGQLTLRGVKKDLRLPLTLKPTANGLELSGQASIKRLDYGVGQGEWRSTESVGDEVKIQYKVTLVRAK